MEQAKKTEQQLVTVCVLCYNSSKTIVETLDSIKNQTYNNIELIISDDFSKDDSVKIAKDWIDKNKHRFKRVLLLTTDHNTGTSGNGNRANFAAKGEWIKIIAADDKLLPNCISDFIEYISYHHEAKIIFSKVVGFGNEEAAKKWPLKDVGNVFDQLTQEEIRIALCISNFLPAPSCIIKTQTFRELGGYNEDIPLIEDWPIWMKATNSGIRLHFMNKETVEYRLSATSVSQNSSISNKYLQSEKLAKKLGQDYLHKSLGAILCFYIFDKCKNGSKIWRVIHLINLFNPFYHKYRKGQKVINRFYKEGAQ